MQPCGACSQIVTPWKFHSFQSGELTWQFKFCLFSCIKISCKSLKPKLTLDHLIYFFFKNDSDVIIVLYFRKLFTFIYGKVLTVVCVSLYVKKMRNLWKCNLKIILWWSVPYYPTLQMAICKDIYRHNIKMHGLDRYVPMCNAIQ